MHNLKEELTKLESISQDFINLATKAAQPALGPLSPLSRQLQHAGEQLMLSARQIGELYCREKARALELEETVKEKERTQIEIAYTLAQLLDIRYPYMAQHTKRVAYFSNCFCQEFSSRLFKDKTFQYALLLHDIGMLTIPDEVLNKKDQLLPEDFQIIRQHPVIGAKLLSGISFLKPAAELVRAHHERWDGRGYPDGKKENDIPLGARLIAVADAFDAMTALRPYRNSLSPEQAKDIILKEAGKQFDPQIVKAFTLAWDKINDYRGYTDFKLLA